MPAESAPGQFGPDSFGSRVQGSEADKYTQGETDATGPDTTGRGRVVPSPTTRRHPVSGRFTDRHTHGVNVDVQRDDHQKQAQAAQQKAAGRHEAMRKAYPHRFQP
jgi:hypothetical protein